MTQQERRPFIRLTVTMERRGDDGLYVYCDELPGFVLSHSDPEAVLADIGPALEVILSEKFGRPITVTPAIGLREALVRNDVIELPSEPITKREYIAA